MKSILCLPILAATCCFLGLNLLVADNQSPHFTNMTLKVKDISFSMCLIPAGSFMMGSPTNEVGRGSDEVQHRVTISKPFYLGKTEVTQDLFESIMGTNPATFKGPRRPVEDVSWNDAVSFCQKLSLLTGKSFRLPTESEWEYACRAGTSTVFPHGNDLDATMANFDGNFPYGKGPKGANREKILDVGCFRPNAWGLQDVVGNVWEWCSDWYGEYPPGDAIDPSGPSTGITRVLRGGGAPYQAVNCRPAFRNWNPPGYKINDLGFRLAATINP